LNDATEVAAGEGFSCARTDAGKVTCWGSNEVGQLGSGSIGGDRRVPAFVAGLTDIISLDAGFQHACAVTRRGRVHCWGAGTKGQLGEGRNHRGTPVVVPGIDDAVEVSAGVGHTCVRRRGGSVACFGDNEFLQTGSPTGTVTARPFTVPDLRDAVAVSAGGGHSCAVRASGRVACWGQNLFGQLGNGAGAKDLNTARPSPVGVQRIEDAAGIAVGVGHSCARRRTGAVACWGLNDRGQLGGGTESNWSTRTPVKDIRNAVEISSGTYQVCTRLAEGTVRCWGDDGGGARRIPQPAPAQGALGLATGSGHACIVRTTGEVVCWGDDTYGQLGDATLAFETTPQAVHGL
jgi:alpha-tubulin suppressor-like RCC1 family protein